MSQEVWNGEMCEENEDVPGGWIAKLGSVELAMHRLHTETPARAAQLLETKDAQWIAQNKVGDGRGGIQLRVL